MKRNQRYGPLLKRTLLNYQAQHLARKFDFSKQSRIVKLLISAINEAMENAEEKVGIKRVKPFHLYVKKHRKKLILPLMTEEYIKPLLEGKTFRTSRSLIRQNCLKIMQEKLPHKELNDLLALIDQWSLIKKSRKYRYKDSITKTPQKLDDEDHARWQEYLDDLAVKAPQDRIDTPDISAPDKLLKRLTEFVSRETGLGNKVSSRLVEEIITLRSVACPRVSALNSGEMPMLLTHVKAHLSEEIATEYRRLAPVIISVLEGREKQFVKLPKTMPNYLKLLKKRIIRVCFQAYRQNGLLTQMEMQWVFQISSSRISELIRSFQNEHNIVVPTPGTVLDAGRSMTHKDIIVRLHLKGYSVKKIARMTYHSPRAVDNYIGTFDRVLLLKLYGMKKSLIARILQKGPTLIAEYLELVDEYYDDCQDIKNYLLAKGVKF